MTDSQRPTLAGDRTTAGARTTAADRATAGARTTAGDRTTVDDRTTPGDRTTAAGYRREGVMPAGWALPVVDATNRDWFTTGTLAVQTCMTCATRQHPPEEICHVCGSMSFSTTPVAAEGTVHSFTVVHHPVHPALDAVVPYTVVLVSLDAEPGLRVVGNLLDAEADEVTIGMPVEAVWEERTADDGTTVLLPQWQRRMGAPAGLDSATD